jgi:hypothetical protein
MAGYKDTRSIFTAYTLTTSYVVQSSPANIEILGVDQAVLDIFYTATDPTNSLQLKVEFANPKTGAPASGDWVVQDSESTSSGVTTVRPQSYNFVGSTSIQVPVPASSKYFRVSVKETVAASTAGTLTVTTTLRSDESFE